MGGLYTSLATNGVDWMRTEENRRLLISGQEVSVFGERADVRLCKYLRSGDPSASMPN